MSFSEILKRAAQPLASRKVRVALTTVLSAYLGERFGLSDEMIYTILGVGTAVILGIAHEDNGKKSSAIGSLKDVFDAAEEREKKAAADAEAEYPTHPV